MTAAEMRSLYLRGVWRFRTDSHGGISYHAAWMRARRSGIISPGSNLSQIYGDGKRIAFSL